MKKPAPKERDIQKAILDFLEARGIFAYRANTGAAEFTDRNGKLRFVHFGKKGQSDITGILPDGRRLDIEVKTEEGKLSKEQDAFINAMSANGGLAFVARSVETVAYVLRFDGYLDISNRAAWHREEVK